MYQPTQNFINELNKFSRRFRARLTIGDTRITDIKTFVINTGSCGADTFTVGSVFASYVDIVTGYVDMSLTGKEFLLETGILFEDDSIEYMPMGYFMVETPSDVTRERDQVQFKAVDRITTKCSGLYVPAVAFPCTIKDVLDDVADQTGVAITCDFDTSGTIEVAFDNLLHRDVLGNIAALLGGFCHADRDGTIRIAPYPTAAGIEVGKDRMMETRPTESTYTIEAVTVAVTPSGQDENGNEIPGVSFSEGNGTRLSFANSYMTQDLFDVMKRRVIGYSFYPGTVKMLGDPRLGPEDAINAINYEDKSFFFPCMSLTHEFDGGFTTTISTPGKNESDDSSKGPLQKTVDALSTDMVITKILVAQKITADEADLKYASIDRADMLEAEIQNLSGEFISFRTGEFETLKAGYADFKVTVTQELEAVTAKINNLDAEYITVTELDAKIATLDFATVERLDAVSAEIDVVAGDLASYKNVVAGNFTAYDADITALKAKDAELTDLIAEKAKITDLEAVLTRTGQLETDLANVETLVNGNLTSANIQSLVISGDKFTVEDGFIKNAMIESLTFDKITGVDINTMHIEVHSDDGKSSWKDNTIQISDASRVRVQIGKDASGDYNIYIWDKDGNLMFDPLYGVQEDGIKQAIIRNDMVSETASISGSKLDIESVIKEVNNGTTTIKSTRIYIDEEEQTLSAAFSALKTYSEGTRTISESNQTDISVMQGQISTLISNTTIEKDGQTVLLKDAYNYTVTDLDSIKTTISDHTSLIDAQSGEILAVQTKANTMEADLSGTKQTLSDVQSDLSGTKSTVATIQTDLSGLTARVSANETAITKKADGSTVTTLSNRVSTFESTLDGFEASLTETDKKVSANETAISDHETRITANESAISLKVATSTFNSYKTTVTDQIATAKSEAVSASESYTDTRIETVNESISDMNAEIAVMQGEIALKVEQTDIDTAVTTVKKYTDGTVAEELSSYSTTAQMNAAITAKANEITTSVAKTYSTKTELSNARGRITTLETWKSTAEQKITDDAIISTVTKSTTYMNDLGEKVSANEIASSINQTAQSVLIDAAKINLAGYVTITDLLSEGATVINGANITTGKIKADYIDVDDLFARDITATGTITGAELIGASGSLSGTFECVNNETYDYVKIENGIIKLRTGAEAYCEITGSTIDFRSAETSTYSYMQILGNGEGIVLNEGDIYIRGTYVKEAIDSLNSNKANTSHTHSYLPLSGGTITGSIAFSNYSQGNVWVGSFGNIGLVTLSNGSGLYLYTLKSGSSGWTTNILLADSNGINLVPKTGGNFTGNLGTNGTFATGGTVTVGGQLLVNNSKIQSTSTYNSTTSTSSNLIISSAGWLNRSTASSRRYKHDIVNISDDLNPEKLLSVPIRQYKFNEDYLPKDDQRYNVDVPGFIAEELYEHYPIAVEVNNGVVEDWNYRMIIPPMLSLIQKLYKRIDELETRITGLN